jgi:hypothetical protein
VTQVRRHGLYRVDMNMNHITLYHVKGKMTLAFFEVQNKQQFVHNNNNNIAFCPKQVGVG